MVITSWMMVYITLSKEYVSVFVQAMGLYMAIWSGSKVAEKMVDAWSAAKGVSPPPAIQPPPTPQIPPPPPPPSQKKD